MSLFSFVTSVFFVSFFWSPPTLCVVGLFCGVELLFCSVVEEEVEEVFGLVEELLMGVEFEVSIVFVL